MLEYKSDTSSIYYEGEYNSPVQLKEETLQINQQSWKEQSWDRHFKIKMEIDSVEIFVSKVILETLLRKRKFYMYLIYILEKEKIVFYEVRLEGMT